MSRDISSTPHHTARWGLRLFAVTLVLLPVVLHGLGCGLTSSGSRWGSADWALTLVLACYLPLCGVAFAIGRLPHLLLVVYSSLMAVGLAELAVRPMVPVPPARLPWPPLVRSGVAGKAMPGIEGEIRFSINDVGVRGPSTPLESADLKILCVGGSTTECLYVTDEKSWPWRLQEKLSESLGQRVYVGNAGRSGDFTLHHTYMIDNYELVSEFDCVIVLCGINDVGNLLRGTYDARKARVPIEALTPDLSQQVYFRRLALYRLASRYYQGLQSLAGQAVQDEAGDWYDSQRALRRKALRQKTLSTPPPDFEQGLARYRRDLEDVIAACRRRNVSLVMMTQPTLYDAQLSEELQQLLIGHCEDHAYTPAALRQMIDCYNGAMIDVCRTSGVECIDLANRLPKDTSVFYDDCHFNIEGCEKVASVVASHLAQRQPQLRAAPAVARGSSEGSVRR